LKKTVVSRCNPFVQCSDDAEDEVELALKVLGYQGRSAVNLSEMKALLCQNKDPYGLDQAGFQGFALSQEEWSSLASRIHTESSRLSRESLVTELVHEPTLLPNMDDDQAMPARASLKA
jgi:hypothetical protein